MKRKEAPFGGMQVVLSGDFFQLPPIVRDGSPTQFVNASRAWKEMDVRICYLEEQFRHEDNTLEAILKEIRSGEVSEGTRALFYDQREKEIPEGISPTRLYTHNIDVDVLNEKELEKISGDMFEYEMQTKGKSNLVETLKKGVLAPETLRLKKDAVVMFVKNNFESGYVNGTLGVIEDFEEKVPIVRTFSGEKISVFSVEWVIEEDGKTLARVEQLPLRLAWAITVHKSQGMSIDAAEIDLSKSFVPGQGYVALSRLRTLAGMYLRGMNEMAFAIHPEVFKLDVHLRKESEKWEKVIARFTPAELKTMHDEFVVKSGGTIDEAEIAKNKTKEKEGIPERVPTHEKTRALVVEGLALAEIAARRGMTVGTIIAHFEKLKEIDPAIDLNRFKHKEKDFKKIAKAFRDSGGSKLTPVHQLLGGTYTFEEIRLTRLFLDK